jgi:peptidoglycan hydrolase-like protein with peptidoglycan-binding domain
MSLPLVINDDIERLVQVNMSGSVGVGGKNIRDDVVLVQSLLNLVGPQEGGPSTKLKVDGISGPLTAGAISRYQKAHKLVADGRIDVCGPTIRVLAPSLHNRGQLPLGLNGIGRPNDEIVRALTTSAYPPPLSSRAEKHPSSAFALKGKASDETKVAESSLISPQAYVGSTGWDFVSSSGADASGWIIGVGFVNIYMKNDREPGVVYRFTWAGSGVGLSLARAGFDFSTADFPSYGTRMMKINPFIGKNPPIRPNDLDLLPTTIYSAGASGGPVGASMMLILWGAATLYVPSTRYINAIIGAQAGTPNAGINLYVGAIAGWT